MALNSSGPISLGGPTIGQSIALELGGSGTSQISLNDTNVRTLAAVPNGTIIMPTNFYGKSNKYAYNYIISSDTSQIAIEPFSIPGYQMGNTDLTITINQGVYVYALGTNNGALNIRNFSPGDTVKIVNNGYIMGKGGDGVNGWLRQNGNFGGPAIKLGTSQFIPVTIDNTNPSAYIAGGGGSGGSYNNISQAGSGGGAGGGKGGDVDSSGFAAGGAGGLPGQAGGNGATIYQGQYCSGGGGGRILPGVGGVAVVFASNTASNPGIGRGGGAGASGTLAIWGYSQGTPYVTIGGSGGGWGAAGGNQNYRYAFSSAANGSSGGNGGSANNNGSPPNSPITLNFGTAGGTGGRAIEVNSNSIIWVAGDTTRVYGAVS